MKYLYYSFKRSSKGWTIFDSKLGCIDYRSNNFVRALRSYFWHMGMSGRKAINLFRKQKLFL